MVSADRLPVETRLDSSRRSPKQEVRLRAACSWVLQPGPSSIPATTIPLVMGDRPTSSYRVLPCFLVGSQQQADTENQRCAPYTLRAEPLGYVEMCEVWRKGESSHGAGYHKSWIAECEASSVHLTQQEH